MSFRLDRFLTIYLFRPLIVKRQLAENKRISILMYHSISDDRENELHPYYRVNTSPTVFESHMRYLYDNNYSVINLNDLENSFDTRDSFEYVVITFDDGFRDFYTSAYPILKKFGFGATVFLPTGFINNRRLSFKDKECMTWDEVQHASREGIIFGSHTITHPQLSNLNTKEIEYEILSSKEKIEDKIGIKVNSFSYPFALPENKEFILKLKKILIKSGYVNGVCTRIGTTNKSDDIIFRKRIPINSQDDLFLFKAKLAGGYDWLYKVQKLFKTLKYNSLKWRKNAC
ncbi:MAG: polysaccharide deacetylase family protein [Syntrophomonas sp.]